MKRQPKQPGEIYQEIQTMTPNDLKERIITALSTHVGPDNRIQRRELVMAVFGIDPGTNLANSKEDRMIRDAIERIESPVILSSSGKGGYWLPATVTEIQAYEGELRSRAMRMLERCSRLNRQAGEFRQPLPAHQMDLFSL